MFGSCLTPFLILQKFNSFKKSYLTSSLIMNDFLFLLPLQKVFSLGKKLVYQAQLSVHLWQSDTSRFWSLVAKLFEFSKIQEFPDFFIRKQVLNMFTARLCDKLLLGPTGQRGAFFQAEEEINRVKFFS